MKETGVGNTPSHRQLQMAIIRVYSQECGIWALSEGFTTGNEDLSTSLQENSLFPFKLEIGGKKLTL